MDRSHVGARRSYGLSGIAGQACYAGCAQAQHRVSSHQREPCRAAIVSHALTANLIQNGPASLSGSGMRWCGLILKEPGLWRHTSSMLNREAQMTTAATHVMEHAGLMPREPSARARSRAVSSTGMDGGTCSCGGQLSQENAVRSSSEVIGAIGGLPFPRTARGFSRTGTSNQ